MRQLVITKCDSFIYYKVRQLVITKCDSYFITKCDKCYYKVRQVLQSVTVLLQSATDITKCDDYYKVRQNTPQGVWSWSYLSEKWSERFFRTTFWAQLFKARLSSSWVNVDHAIKIIFPKNFVPQFDLQFFFSISLKLKTSVNF